MPVYKVGFPYIVVEAPHEKAALAAYERFCEGWESEWTPEANVCQEIPDYVVDAEGHEIEEEEE
jgi:hypothetical protein